MGKIDILNRAIIGECKKLKNNIFWSGAISAIKSKPEIPVVVSLTSYGERVSKIVPYTILSIFNQSVRPERIILWLDETKWNSKNIPSKLKDLTEKGLEVRFCKDIRSYTKLIPTLRLCPDKTIITIDDDLYYSSGFLKEIYSIHQQYPDRIIAENFCYPKFNNGKPAIYRDWEEYHLVGADKSFSPLLIFPQGFGGVLYPVGSLHDDTTDEGLFMELSPYADDIWFYVMGILNGTKKQYAVDSKTRYYYLDLFRQIRTRDRLHDLNVGEAKNDKQLKALLDHYNISLKDYE